MDDVHQPSIEHRGSFAHAVCPCGWSGPGRRAVARAAEDRAAHELLGAGADELTPAAPPVTRPAERAPAQLSAV